MKYPDIMKDYFVRELEIVIKKVEETPNQLEIVYFLSAVSASLNRIINIEYNKDVLFLERTFKYCHGEIDNYLKRSIQRLGGIPLPRPPQPQRQSELPIPDSVPPEEEIELAQQLIATKNLPLTLIDPKFFDNIIVNLKKFKIAIEKDEDVIEPLKYLVELAYTLLGNGRYLLEKGDIKLDFDLFL